MKRVPCSTTADRPAFRAPAPHQFVGLSRVCAKSLPAYESTPRGPVIDFNIRPLHPTLLTYAAHDVHYMFQLYVFLVEQLSVGWCKAVFRETARRCQSYADEDPNENSPYAPAFYA